MTKDVPTHGLIIREPWIDLILAGRKDWEMRSGPTHRRGVVALIRRGTGLVAGVAVLTGVLPALSKDEIIAAEAHHCIPVREVEHGEAANWNVPWVLSGVVPIDPPIGYQVRSGAVIWVTLDGTARRKIAERLGALPAILPTNPVSQRVVSSNGLVRWVHVTEGNLRHGHIYLRSVTDLLPSDAVGGSNKLAAAPVPLTVDWEGGPEIVTDIAADKMIFRDRTLAPRFFAQFGITAGDRIGILQLDRYRFRLVPPR